MKFTTFPARTSVKVELRRRWNSNHRPDDVGVDAHPPPGDVRLRFVAEYRRIRRTYTFTASET